jgi:hypothetical protein
VRVGPSLQLLQVRVVCERAQESLRRQISSMRMGAGNEQLARGPPRTGVLVATASLHSESTMAIGAL